MDFFYPPQNGLSVPGLLIGRVVANHDDKHGGMIQASYYSHEDKSNTTAWMRVAAPAAGKNRGVYFLPETGDEVLIAFINNDPNNPYVIGSLWNQENSFPDGVVTAENTVKAVVTRSGSKLLFSDEEGKEKITISTPKGMHVVLDEQHNTISIGTRDGKNKITLNGESGDITVSTESKVVLEAKDLELSAKNGISLRAQKIDLKASNEFAVEGARARIKGNASLELSSSGITEIKGGLVKLNG